ARVSRLCIVLITDATYRPKCRCWPVIRTRSRFPVFRPIPWLRWSTRRKKTRSKGESMKIRILIALAGVLVVMAVVWRSFHIVALMARDSRPDIPTTHVKRGHVTIIVSARGELQGGNSEVLTAPMSGGGDMAITYLREPGELVKKDDVIAQFDTTQ